MKRPAPATESLSDAADDDLVLLLALRGDTAERALEELYARYSAAVYGLALRVTRDTRAAEEVLQDTFWRAWEHAARYEPGRVKLATWLLRITHNAAVSEVRYRARRPQAAERPRTDDSAQDGAVSVDVADPQADVLDAVWQGQLQVAVRRGLGALPAVQRQAVELAYFGGRTHTEIAAIQDAPASTVKTRLALGLRKLADGLAAYR